MGVPGEVPSGSLKSWVSQTNGCSCGPEKIGSKIAVRNGIVPGVEITRCRVDLAAAEVAAVTMARTQRAASVAERSTTDADA